jgi:DNA-binding CsgD family transcriptional regulator/Flp pilus assembly protein TadD
MARSFDTSVVCPVLIGREAFLASFERVFEQVKDGQGQTILISGEAGIGKSRLVAEVKVRVGQEQAHFLQGHCFEQDRALPFAPLVDLLRALLLGGSRTEALHSLAPVAPELIKLLPDLDIFLPEVTPTPALEPEREKRRLFVALTHFLLGQTEQRPLVLSIEDLHWSDDTSLEFLLSLARHLRSHPLLLLLTYRGEEVHPALAHFLSALDRERATVECSLTPLTMEEVQAMLRAIFQLKRPVRRDFLETLYQLTEGNPFFVEEVLKSLLAAGDIFFADGVWDRKPLAELHIPRSVSDAVQQRIRLLSEEARETLELAAVAGRYVDVALLQALTGRPEPELMQCIETLMAAQLLVETSAEQVAFRHALTQQAVYQGLLAHKRKALHRRVGQTMERLYAPTLESHLAELAYHFSQAQAWKEALEYAERAGEKALALYTPRAAVEQFTRALLAASHLPGANPLPLYRARGAAYEHLGEFDAAQCDYEQAIQWAHAAGEQQEEWQSLWGLWWLWANYSDPRLNDLCQRLLDLARLLDDPLKVAFSKNLQGYWLVSSNQPEAGFALHEEALPVLQQHGESHAVVRTLLFLGHAAAEAGELRRAVAYYDQAIALARSIGDVRVLAGSLAYRGFTTSPAFTEAVFSVRGSLAACQRDLQEARRLADEIEVPTSQALVHFHTSLVLISFGLLGEGLSHTRTALSIASEVENRQWMAGSYCSLGEAYLVLLDPKEAIALLETGLAIARQIDSVEWMVYITVPLARALLLSGDLPRTATTLAQLLPPEQAPRSIQERRAAWVRGELALAQRRPDLALRLADEMIASAPGSAQRAEGQPIPALLKLRGEALCALGQMEEAIHALEEARQGAQAEGAYPLLWQIHRALGRVYARAQQKQLAHSAFAAARQIIADLADSLAEAEQRERFLQVSLTSLPKEQPLTPRQSAKHAFGGLSEREREIARLVAQGRSNREIAEAFIISERTVETHLGRIYAKLGFSTRAQLAAWVVEKGLALPALS